MLTERLGRYDISMNRGAEEHVVFAMNEQRHWARNILESEVSCCKGKVSES
jgi:hypothetical protein